MDVKEYRQYRQYREWKCSPNEDEFEANPYDDPDENEFLGIIANHKDEDSDSVFNYYI